MVLYLCHMCWCGLQAARDRTLVHLCASSLQNFTVLQDFYSLVNISLERSWWPGIRWCGTGMFQEQSQCLNEKGKSRLKELLEDQALTEQTLLNKHSDITLDWQFHNLCALSSYLIDQILYEYKCCHPFQKPHHQYIKKCLRALSAATDELGHLVDINIKPDEVCAHLARDEK